MKEDSARPAFCPTSRGPERPPGKSADCRPGTLRGFFPEDLQLMFEDEGKAQAAWLARPDWPYDDDPANAYNSQDNSEMKRLIGGVHYSDLGLHLESHLKTKKRRLFSLDETDLINQSHSSEEEDEQEVTEGISDEQPQANGMVLEPAKLSKDASEAKEMESTARGDSEGDLNGESGPANNAIPKIDLDSQNKKNKIRTLDFQRTARKHLDDRNSTEMQLGKRKETSDKPKVLLNWMQLGAKPEERATNVTTPNESSPVEETLIEKKLGLRGIKIKPLSGFNRSSYQSSEKVSPLLENRSVKYKHYTASDKKVLVKAERLVNYWRDPSRQTPILFKEMSLVNDESQKTVLSIDLSRRKILVNGEPYTAKPANRDKRKKRSTKKFRPTRLVPQAN